MSTEKEDLRKAPADPRRNATVSTFAADCAARPSAFAGATRPQRGVRPSPQGGQEGGGIWWSAGDLVGGCLEQDQGIQSGR